MSLQLELQRVYVQFLALTWPQFTLKFLEKDKYKMSKKRSFLC